ncbi:diguanylate cyclase [Shewanella sp. ULN5]|uniref:tetratricopeptide repeat-containing diguanylate cyclase n=1 Tax=Shewanella sp. ULN5 TaxID=2994678 RepID=UPI00273DF7C0|nr:tetratricopeptide repeat-containing diguanylate cyclase [Shewanella sp. ULN5]MDP5145758.1 diguanylate cyclase [Shewanella sp. ULN5]
MNKRLCIFFSINLLLTIILSHPAKAEYYENARADEIYQKFDLVDYTAEEANALLTEYKSIIDNDDEIRQKLLVRLTCWNQPSETQAELDKAIQYAEQQLLIYAEPYPSEINTDLLLCLGYYKQYVGQMDGAFKDISTAISNAYQLENPRLIADGRSIRGAMESYQGDYATALEDLITAQHLYEKLNITYWANDNLNNLAASYRRFGDPETAIKYQTKLEQTYLNSGMLFEADNVNVQIAFSLEELGRFKESNERFYKSLKFWQSQKETNAIASTQVNIAGNLINQGEVDKALALLIQAEPDIPVEYDGQHSFMSLFFAKAYLVKNELDKALEYSQKASIDFKRGGNRRGESQNLQLQSQIYHAKGDIENAYKSLSAFLEMHLSLDKQIMSDRNAEMQTRFNTDKVLAENENLLEVSTVKELQLQIMQRNESLQIVIIVLVAIILIIVSVFAYKQLKRKRKYQSLALTDELTRLSNRRAIYAQSEHFIKQAKLSSQPFSIILFDADHFKQVNDKFGHDVGDKVLMKLASLTMGMMRESDVVGRVGGEEFLILLPNIAHNTAMEIAQRLLDCIANYDWSHIAPSLVQTVSAGVATLEHETELSPLLLKADSALYKAKSAGRNCVISA